MSELFKALSIAQSQMSFAVKDSVNPHFKSKYADLASCWEACREPLTKNGLSIIQFITLQNAQHVLVTKLAYTSGESIEGYLPLLTASNTMQALGSAITYARRYGLSSMVGICQDDDDGNLASVTNQPAQKPSTGKFQSAADHIPTKELTKDIPKMAPTPPDDKEKVEAGFYIIPTGIYANKRVMDVSFDDLKQYAQSLHRDNTNGMRPPKQSEILLLGEINKYLDSVTTTIKHNPAQSVYQKPGNFNSITDPMQKRLFAIHNKSGWTNDELKNFLKGSMNVDSSKNLNSAQYAEICKILEDKIPYLEAIMLPVTVR